MLHRKRIWSIFPAESAEWLAEQLTQYTFCACNGFRLAWIQAQAEVRFREAGTDEKAGWQASLQLDACKFETTAANVQDLDDKVAQHAREVHKIPSLDKEMWMKIHKAEK